MRARELFDGGRFNTEVFGVRMLVVWRGMEQKSCMCSNYINRYGISSVPTEQRLLPSTYVASAASSVSLRTRTTTAHNACKCANNVSYVTQAQS